MRGHGSWCSPTMVTHRRPSRQVEIVLNDGRVPKLSRCDPQRLPISDFRFCDPSSVIARTSNFRPSKDVARVRRNENNLWRKLNQFWSRRKNLLAEGSVISLENPDVNPCRPQKQINE